jgi:hypothetical protein
MENNLREKLDSIINCQKGLTCVTYRTYLKEYDNEEEKENPLYPYPCKKCMVDSVIKLLADGGYGKMVEYTTTNKSPSGELITGFSFNKFEAIKVEEE